MRVRVVGEGPHERSALPTIVCRTNAAVTECDFEYVKNVPRSHGKGSVFYKKAVRAMIDAETTGFDGLVFLIDRDDDSSRHQQMSDAQDNLAQSMIPRACGVAVRTFDAWFLSDESALTKVVSESVNRQPDPEGIDDPKSTCKSIAEAASPSIALGDFYAQVAEEMNLDTVCTRCSRGFGQFHQRLAAMTT